MTTRTPPRGPRVSACAAADLTGLTQTVLDSLIDRGLIRTERIGGKTFVDLDDAERAASESGEGGRA